MKNNRHHKNSTKMGQSIRPWVIKVINSCKTRQQLHSAMKCVELAGLQQDNETLNALQTKVFESYNQ